MNRNRLFYLDAARGFAILLVVLGHTWETEDLLPVLIYSFHVPLFFMISGILTAYTGRDQRPLTELLRSGLRTLILPYLFFELVFLLIFGIRSHFDFSSLGGNLCDSLLLQPLNVPMWFLPTLFLAELTVILLVRISKNRCLSAVLCLILYALSFPASGMAFLPSALVRYLSAVGFVALGYFSCSLVLEKDPPLSALLCAAAADGVLAWINGKTGIYKLTFHNPLLFTVCAVTGSFCVIFLLKKFRCPPLELIGKNSLTILGLHIIVLRVLQEILGLRTDTIAGGLAALAAVCLLLAPVCLFLNRFFPALVGRPRRPGSKQKPPFSFSGS